MKRIILLWAITLVWAEVTLAQTEPSSAWALPSDIQTILDSIERNNTTLQSLQASMEAEKRSNRANAYLSDPEIGFNYLFGNPSSIGNRRDLSVTQTFDFATISGRKGKVAQQQNQLVEWQYRIDRMSVLLEAKEYCFDLIYYNALLKELTIRMEHAISIAETHKGRLESGQGNALEYNNSLLNLSSAQAEMTKTETLRNVALSQLVRLNGGNPIALATDSFAPLTIPIDFEQWFDAAAAKSPMLAYVKQEIELGREQVALSKAMNLPTLTAGYMSEMVVGQRYDGVSVGISVPLWGNKNRTEQSKADLQAAELRSLDARNQFYNQLEMLYQRAVGLKKTADIYRQSLASANNLDLLKIALDAGQISMPDYVLQMEIYYNAIGQALSAERDCRKAFAELSAVGL